MDLRGLTFLDGVELADGSFVLGLEDPEVNQQTNPHTGAAVWTEADGWQQIGQIDRQTVAMSTNESASGFVLLHPRGKWFERSPEFTGHGEIVTRDGSPIRFDLRSLSTVDGSLFCGGVDRQLYRRTSHSSWDDHSDLATADMSIVFSFEAVTGFNQNEAYAVGFEGDICSLIGGSAQRIESPTNMNLTSIAAGSDRCVAGGMSGILLEGRGNDWRVIEHDQPMSDVWDIAYFDGRFYLATFDTIFVLYDQTIEIMELPTEIESTFKLFAGKDGLWSIGDTTVAKFDGQDWRVIAQA